MVFYDGTVISFSSVEELEFAIENVKDDCDEDDDNNFDDDELISPAQIIGILNSCSDWTVNKFKLDNNDIENNYLNYFFNFSNDGSILVRTDTTNYSGTFSTSKNEGDIYLTIAIPELIEFNAIWQIDKINKDEAITTMELREGNNRLEIISTCN